MTISFDSAQHERLLARLEAAATAIQGELDTLHGEVNALQHAWSGAAQDAYATAQAEWTESMKALRDMLVRARAGAARAGDRLRSADEAVRALWGD